MDKTVVNNAFWIIGCKVCKAILTLLVNMITARYLGVADYGVLNYAASIVTFVTPIMKLGLDGILVKEYIEKSEKTGETIGTAYILNVCSAILCIVGVFFFTMIVNASEIDTIITCTIYSVLLLFQAFEMIQYWFQAKLMSKYSALSMLAAYVVVTVLQIILIFIKAPVYLFALSSSVDYAIIALILFAVYKHESCYKVSFSFARAKELLKGGRYFIVAELLVVVFSQTDIVMLKLMTGNSSAGIYAAAQKCAGMVSFVFVAIIDSIRPTVFSAKTKEERDLRMKEMYSIIIYLSFIVSVIITLFSDCIIHIMYGTGYAEAGLVLRVAVWFTTFSYLGTIRNVWLLSEHREKFIIHVNIVGAISNVLLNYFFIRLWGSVGAAISSLLTQVIANVLMSQLLVPVRYSNKLLFNSLNPRFFVGLLKRLCCKK